MLLFLNMAGSFSMLGHSSMLSQVKPMSGERDGALEILEMELLSSDIDTEDESQTYLEFSAINAMSSLFQGQELSSYEFFRILLIIYKIKAQTVQLQKMIFLPIILYQSFHLYSIKESFQFSSSSTLYHYALQSQLILNACLIKRDTYTKKLSKKVSVLGLLSCDKLDSPAVVIQSLYQADSFPCSVASLGRTNLFKALDISIYTKMPMATQDLTWATGKREISASPHTLQQPHTPLKSVYRIYPDNSYA